MSNNVNLHRCMFLLTSFQIFSAQIGFYNEVFLGNMALLIRSYYDILLFLAISWQDFSKILARSWQGLAKILLRYPWRVDPGSGQYFSNQFLKFGQLSLPRITRKVELFEQWNHGPRFITCKPQRAEIAAWNSVTNTAVFIFYLCGAFF